MLRVVPMLLLAGLAGCGLAGDGNGPTGVTTRTEVIVEAPDDLAGSVRIDSVSWVPLFAPYDQPLEYNELEGTFSARFASLAEEPLAVRYDLRFYDEDDFLVDAYIPLGQPVSLAPGEARRVAGFFVLEAGDPRDLERVTTMRLYARILRPGP